MLCYAYLKHNKFFEYAQYFFKYFELSRTDIKLINSTSENV